MFVYADVCARTRRKPAYEFACAIADVPELECVELAHLRGVLLVRAVRPRPTRARPVLFVRSPFDGGAGGLRVLLPARVGDARSLVQVLGFAQNAPWHCGRGRQGHAPGSGLLLLPHCRCWLRIAPGGGAVGRAVAAAAAAIMLLRLCTPLLLLLLLLLLCAPLLLRLRTPLLLVWRSPSCATARRCVTARSTHTVAFMQFTKQAATF